MNNWKLEEYINELLLTDQYSDYAPNGLQVEGRTEVAKVVCGVTASMALIEAAIEHKADTIFVHHGYFWKGENQTITGMKQRRIKALLENDINLYSYHLPLDGHPVLGNNAQLGQYWGVQNASSIAPLDLLWKGELPNVTLEDFTQTLSTTLVREPLVISGGHHTIKKLMWCSGGAQGYLAKAAELGADAYVSGEVSEKNYHEAKEYGIHYFVAGHHATERGGAKAIANYLNRHTDLSCEFIDCANPI
ncbi:MAG: Nif3-like dinuclear metal center hexameric protein [Ostreibacterium sp.]